MSYPTKGNPTAKHDLFVPRLPPPSTTFMDAFGLANASALFQKLNEPVPPDLKQLASVYSYADGPKPPLSRALFVIGVIPETHALMRKLIGDEEDVDEVDKSLHRCSVAVKRADGYHASQLEEKYILKSKAFAQFVRRLRQEGCAAVLGHDKYTRMGILKPLRDSVEEGYHQNDFHAACYVGTTDNVKAALKQTVAPAAAVATPPAENGGLGSNDDEPVWNPDGGEPTWQPDDGPTYDNNAGNGDEPLWQPDDGGGGGADATSSSTGLWEAPSSSGGAGESLWEPSSKQESTGLGLWEPSTSSDGGFGDGGGAAATEWDQVQPSLKREREKSDDEEENENGNEFHANAGAAAADKFYSNLTRNQGTRADSRLYHMRSFNGWVKATQISELNPLTKGPNGRMGGPLRILDLACGKGGDLTKWVLHPRGIANYVGSDVARGSLVDAAYRARKMRHKMKLCTFSCADLGHDVPGRLRSSKHKHMQKLLTWSLQNESPGETGVPDFKMERGGGIQPDDRFDVVSIQFAIHYMMQTKNRARRFFRTVSQLLDVGGNLVATTIDARVIVSHMMNLGLNLHFDDDSDESLQGDPIVTAGGGACRLTFEPKIVRQIFEPNTTGEELPESLFGLEYTFTLVEGSDHGAGVGDAVNLPEWLTPIPMLVGLAKEVGLELEYAQNFHEFFKERKNLPSSQVSLYNMKVLNRNGTISQEEFDISRLYMAIRFKKVREPELTPLSDDDAEEDEEEEEEIDPAVKAKLLPMAMMKAKRANQGWADLSAEEKQRLTDIELRILAKK